MAALSPRKSGARDKGVAMGIQGAAMAAGNAGRAEAGGFFSGRVGEIRAAGLALAGASIGIAMGFAAAAAGVVLLSPVLTGVAMTYAGFAGMHAVAGCPS